MAWLPAASLLGMRQRLGLEQWRAQEAAHAARVERATRGWRSRRRHGVTDPVEDFLFVYYRATPAMLRRWHPGVGVVLADAAGTDRAHWRWYREQAGGLSLDADAFRADRHELLRRARAVLAGTASRPAHLGCFGMHEWAMSYRLAPSQQRHPTVPLRLGRAGTDAVVERHEVRCTHVDAYRFFPPAAQARAAVHPSRALQAQIEQPGCLHANMDLYHWAYRLLPAAPSDLVMDAFDVAREVRVLDMRASPYDLRAHGLDPVPVETSAGKAEYVAAQRAFAARAQPLRERLLAVLDEVLAATAQRGGTS